MIEAKSQKTILESLFPSCAEHWEVGLSQAQHEHERKRATHQDVHGENQNTFEQVKVKVPPKPYEPTKEERQSTKPHSVLFIPRVMFASRPRAQTEDTRNRW